MTPERWQELKQLVGSALAVPEAEREAFVRGRASQDSELFGQALSLLSSRNLAEGFLSAPAIEAAGSILDSVISERHKPIATGALFGPYQIVGLIGAGGMGEVYRARDERLKRDVAIKVLPSAFTENSDRLRRFEQEARAAGGLNHPNILAIHDIGSKDGAPYVVSELLEGDTLRSRLASGVLPPRKAIDYAIQVARGLAAAHERGIVHRDLKPENLFITRDGRVKILDFGLAKVTQPESTAARGSAMPTTPLGTGPGVVMGTAGYMSPEQVRGETTDARSDIFSLGAILYEMLSGKRAFRGDSAAETMAAVLKEDPPELSATGKNMPPGVERIVRHCLEKSREERFHSARDLAFDLEALSGLFGQSAASPAAGGRRSVHRALGAAALVLLGGALATAWMVLRRHEPSAPSFNQLTFRRGEVFDARFAPDGRTVVYSASWESARPEIFTVRTDSTESRSTGLVVEKLLAVSSKGELAVLLGDDKHPNWFSPGTLARVPLGGGTPRELAENVTLADWSPDGAELAVVRRLPVVKSRLEYPVGTTLYEYDGYIPCIRVSPKGDRVALLEAALNLSSYVLSTVDRKGKRQIVPGQWRWVSHVLWSPRGDELIIQGGRSMSEGGFRALSLSGRERVLVSNSMGLELDDVAADGRLLVTQAVTRNGLMCHRRSETGERELAWLDDSELMGLAADGSAITFTEYNRDPPPKGGIYLRRTDGSAAMRLGDGWFSGGYFSADGRWVTTFTGDHSAGLGLVLLPTGAGSPRTIPIEGVKLKGARFLPKDKGFLIKAEKDGAFDLFLLGPQGGTPRPLHAAEVTLGSIAVSPDGERVAYPSKDHYLRTMSLSGRDSRVIPGPAFDEDSMLKTWSDDGRFLYVMRRVNAVPSLIDRLEITTGRRELWRALSPEDPSGLQSIGSVEVTPDGQSYAYSYTRVLSSTLYVVGNVR